MQDHADVTNVQSTCLHLASILCYEPSFVSPAEASNLHLEISKALQLLPSDEALALQGMAVLEVMSDSPKVVSMHRCIFSNFDDCAD